MIKLIKNITIVILLSSFINLTFAINRLIIKFKPTILQTELLATKKINSKTINAQLMKPIDKAQLNVISNISAMKVNDIGAIATGAHVLQLEHDLSHQELAQLINELEKQLYIEYIEEDRILKPLAPALNPVQWDMQLNFDDPTYNSWTGDNFIGAWSLVSSPGNSIIAAVIDTGYTPHANIISNLQQTEHSSKTYGYSFISDCRIAGTCTSSTSNTNASINPIPDGLDLGDALTQEEIDTSNGFFSNCDADLNSSWHGTHVTGTIIAQGYNSNSKTGILGGAYDANVLPVRVLGKCGGRTSDVINAMLWSANLHPSITNNNPAEIVNISLGARGSCNKSMQDAINQISNSTLIVVAAGNSANNVANAFPANCKNIIVVAAKGPTDLAYYSNYGATNITASGGDMSYNNSFGGILSTIWDTSKISTNFNGDFTYYQGTSMATPHVVAAIANIIGYLKNNNLKWNYTRITQILQNTSTSNYTNCNSQGCAASGALNVENAINYIIKNYNQILEPNNNVIVFSQANSLNQTIKFTNNNTNAISIASAEITGNSDIIIKNDKCSNQTLLANNSCTISITMEKNTNLNPSFLRLKNTNDTNISTINIDKSSINDTPPPPSPQQNANGGCAIAQNGDDLSLIIIMLLVSCLYFLRKKNNFYLKGIK